MPVRVLRALGVATLVVASVTALSSCSQPGAAPGAAASSRTSDVVDPSVPSATPTEIVASDTPAPVATEVATSAPTASTDSRTAVVPAITTPDATVPVGSIDVAAIVTGVVEGGGSCVATLSSGSTTRSATSLGVAAGSYTGCPAVTFKSVPAGTWQVRVRYDSSKAAGTSAVRTVQVG